MKASKCVYKDVSRSGNLDLTVQVKINGLVGHVNTSRVYCNIIYFGV